MQVPDLPRLLLVARNVIVALQEPPHVHIYERVAEVVPEPRRVHGVVFGPLVLGPPAVLARQAIVVIVQACVSDALGNPDGSKTQ